MWAMSSLPCSLPQEDSAVCWEPFVHWVNSSHQRLKNEVQDPRICGTASFYKAKKFFKGLYQKCNLILSFKASSSILSLYLYAYVYQHCKSFHLRFIIWYLMSFAAKIFLSSACSPLSKYPWQPVPHEGYRSDILFWWTIAHVPLKPRPVWINTLTQKNPWEYERFINYSAIQLRT